MNGINSISSNKACGAGGSCCRSGACSSCKNCPSCASNRDGAKSTLMDLKKMLGMDPNGTKDGVADAFKQNGDLANNPILMKILGLLGLTPGQ